VGLIAASTFEWAQVVAGAVAALAALGTLAFAWLTVRGAQALRADEQRAHLLDLAADFGEAGMRLMGSVSDPDAWRDARSTRHRFRAALDATEEPLPASRVLLEMDWSPASMGDAQRRHEEADKVLAAALDELARFHARAGRRPPTRARREK